MNVKFDFEKQIIPLKLVRGISNESCKELIRFKFTALLWADLNLKKTDLHIKQASTDYTVVQLFIFYQKSQARRINV